MRILNRNKKLCAIILVIISCLVLAHQVSAEWSEQSKLTASDGAAFDEFGWSVSISGDYAIVGADSDNDHTGSAYIFETEMDCPTADLYGGDCCVDFKDFAVLGYQWLAAPGSPSADIAPEVGDGVVNLLDLAVLSEQWLQCGE